MVPGWKLLTITSAVAMSARKARVPPAVRRSRVTLRLPRLHAQNQALRSSEGDTVTHRAMSPSSGSSILSTSAPRSASIEVACGPWIRIARSSTLMPSSAPIVPPLHVHHISDDADLVYGHILGDGPTQQLAGADVEMREMEGTLHDMPRQPAPRQWGSLVSTGILEGVEGAVHIDQQHTFPLHDHPRHVPRRQVGDGAHRDKSCHGH